MVYNPDLSFGASGDWFGHRDYTGNLKKIWDAGTAGQDRQKKLMAERQKMLSWMGSDAAQGKIRDQNKLGIEGGLGSAISSDEYQKGFMGQNMDINPETGKSYSDASKDYYGHADLYHDRATGKSWADILSGLDQNTGDLRGGNVKGGGGLYDEVKTQANFEGQQGQWSDAVTGLQDSILDMGTTFGDMATAQQDFQTAQLDWQKEESAKQREHEAMLLAEQRKVKSATPTHVKNPVSQLAIGPGKVAAPQSASSLARKRLGSAPLVTGLNIGSKKTSMNIK